MAPASDAALARGLREVVGEVFGSGVMDNLTVKRVRAAVEEKLHLEPGFFKSDGRWNAKSKSIITAESEARFAADEGQERASSPAALPLTSTRPPAKSKSSAPSKIAQAKRGTRRPSPGTKARQKKCQRTEAVESSSESALTSQLSEKEKLPAHSTEEDEATAPKRRVKAGRGEKPGKKRASLLEESDGSSDEASPPSSRAGPTKKAKAERDKEDEEEEQNAEVDGREGEIGGAKGNGEADGQASESEMSSLIDEAPPPKKQRRSTPPLRVSKKASQARSSKPRDDPVLEPQEAEVKRLQSWLLKCGVRKLWHRELAAYSTPSSKIKHLKGMLKEVGMEGRFSAEKAKQIKEERELQAEVEAVQDNAKLWGDVRAEESEASGNGGKPQRRLARGLRDLDFLGDDGGEETD
ncbi:MAG: hypothetical protein M1832_003506 [Thelocarpon impressellum]|nr:MAG: hypothetical protein M1832_003506 [Thelocarpon impressellum]